MLNDDYTQEIACALVDLGESIEKAACGLGTNDAVTEMGAIEALAATIHDSTLTLSVSLDSIAAALNNIATAITWKLR